MKLALEIGFLPELDSPKVALLDSLMRAHRTAALNNRNASTTGAVNAWFGSRRCGAAIASAILTTGEVHAPLSRARWNLRNLAVEDVARTIAEGKRIAGFGNSFFKDGIDPAFAETFDLLKPYELIWGRIIVLQNALWAADKRIWPNAALITAAVCEIVGWPDGAEDLLFVFGRASAWTERMIETTKGELSWA